MLCTAIPFFWDLLSKIIILSTIDKAKIYNNYRTTKSQEIF